MSDIHSCSYYCDRPACIKAQRDELRDKFQVMQAQAEIDAKVQRIAALQSGEPVVFTCHGNNAPAYGCNKPGDMSGTYYKAPQPVVPEDTLRAAFIAGFRYCAVEWAGRDDLYSDVHSEKFCKGMANALKALLIAGKENKNE
jgi:hypothetical protein